MAAERLSAKIYLTSRQLANAIEHGSTEQILALVNRLCDDEWTVEIAGRRTLHAFAVQSDVDATHKQQVEVLFDWIIRRFTYRDQCNSAVALFVDERLNALLQSPRARIVAFANRHEFKFDNDILALLFRAWPGSLFAPYSSNGRCFAHLLLDMQFHQVVLYCKEAMYVDMGNDTPRNHALDVMRFLQAIALDDETPFQQRLQTATKMIIHAALHIVNNDKKGDQMNHFVVSDVIRALHTHGIQAIDKKHHKAIENVTDLLFSLLRACLTRGVAFGVVHELLLDGTLQCIQPYTQRDNHTTLLIHVFEKCDVRCVWHVLLCVAPECFENETLVQLMTNLSLRDTPYETLLRAWAPSAYDLANRPTELLSTLLRHGRLTDVKRLVLDHGMPVYRAIDGLIEKLVDTPLHRAISGLHRASDKDIDDTRQLLGEAMESPDSIHPHGKQSTDLKLDAIAQWYAVIQTIVLGNVPETRKRARHDEDAPMAKRLRIGDE